jgi:hypothetical protein
MTTLSSERLAGILAGLFLFLAADSLFSIVKILTLPLPDFSNRLPNICAALLPGLIEGLIGYGYLRGNRKKWFHTGVLVLLSLSLGAGLWTCLEPMLLKTATYPGQADLYLHRMFWTGLGRMLASLGLIALVFLLIKKEKHQASPNT